MLVIILLVLGICSALVLVASCRLLGDARRLRERNVSDKNAKSPAVGPRVLTVVRKETIL